MDKLRRTGRTTRQAIRYVAMLLANPGATVKVKDHYNTHDADLRLTAIICNILTCIDIEFKVQDNNITIIIIKDDPL